MKGLYAWAVVAFSIVLITVSSCVPFPTLHREANALAVEMRSFHAELAKSYDNELVFCADVAETEAEGMECFQNVDREFAEAWAAYRVAYDAWRSANEVMQEPPNRVGQAAGEALFRLREAMRLLRELEDR